MNKIISFGHKLITHLGCNVTIRKWWRPNGQVVEHVTMEGGDHVFHD